MIAYSIFMIILLVLLYHVKKDKWNIIDVLIIILLVCFSGLRYGIGTDYNLYEGLYNTVNSYGLEVYRTGVGYYYLIYFLNNILSCSFKTAIFLFSLITNLSIYYYIKTNSSNPRISIFLYVTLGFYISSFNIMRQMLSLAILLVSSNYLYKNKYFKWILLSIIGISIHSTNAIVTLVFIINKFIMKEHNIKGKNIVIISVILLLAYSTFYEILTKYINGISFYSLNQSLYVPGIGTYLRIIIFTIIFTIIYIENKKLININEKNKDYINAYFIGSCIMVLSIKNIMFMRVASNLLISIIIIAPELYKCINKNSRLSINIIIDFILLIYFYAYIMNFDGVLPYNTIFSYN